jgi:hypothetical protein
LALKDHAWGRAVSEQPPLLVSKAPLTRANARPQLRIMRSALIGPVFGVIGRDGEISNPGWSN